MTDVEFGGRAEEHQAGFSQHTDATRNAEPTR